MERTTAELWMREALVEARKAAAAGEIPIGAVLLVNGKIIARGHNHAIGLNDPTAHAEIQALRHGAHAMRNYRIPGSTLIVTVEPCAMCAGAMIHARVEEVVFGAPDPKGGAICSHFQLAQAPQLNHRMEVTGGVLEEECAGLLREFFAARR